MLLTLAAGVVALLLLRVGTPPPIGETVIVTLITVTIASRVFRQRKLYALPALLDPAAAFTGFALGIAAGGVASIATLALLHGRPGEVEYLIVEPLAWCLASGSAILAARSILAWRLQRHARNDRLTLKYAVVGATAISQAFLQSTSSDPFSRPVGVYDDPDLRGAAPPAVAVRGSLDDLVAYARHNPLDAIILALPLDQADRIAAVQQRLAGLGTEIFLTSDLAGSTAANPRLAVFANRPVLSLATRPLLDWRGVRKAAFDLVVGATLLVLALPLMAAIAIAIKANSAGPVLFRQTRDGLNGVPFVMFKFRSMVHDDAADQSVQATRFDPRVTWVGSWLRRTSLDELPQLFNVLRGDMSLVGPRPHLATTRAADRLFCDIVPNYAARHRMKPGLTGWAQIQGLRGETRTEQQIAERVAQDLYYIEHWSLRFDLRILLLTVLNEVLGGSNNAY